MISSVSAAKMWIALFSCERSHIMTICAFKANMGRDRFNAIKDELAKREKD